MPPSQGSDSISSYHYSVRGHLLLHLKGWTQSHLLLAEGLSTNRQSVFSSNSRMAVVQYFFLTSCHLTQMCQLRTPSTRKIPTDPTRGHAGVISTKLGFGPVPLWFSWMLCSPAVSCQGKLRKHPSTLCKCKSTWESAVMGPSSDLHNWSNAAQLPRRYRLLLLHDRFGWKSTGASDLGHIAHLTTTLKKLKPCWERVPEGKARRLSPLSSYMLGRTLSRIPPAPSKMTS